MEFSLVNKFKTNDLIFDARYHPTDEDGLVAAATIGGDINFYKSGRLQSTLRRHHKGSSIRKVRFSDSGSLVTIAKTVKVHDLSANKTVHTLGRELKSNQLYSVKTFGHDIISAGDDDGFVYVWDTRTPGEPIFTSHDCEQYISDIDGKYDARKLMLCSSGEGTLTAYDMRALKMIEPQSELFEAGFQCLKRINLTRKVVLGSEDGAIYVFNHNEWAHTSGKFAVKKDTHNRGKCSIDCLDVLPDESTFLVGCSDGRLRTLTLWPHKLLSETIMCRKAPIESIQVNPIEGRSEILVCGDNYLELYQYSEIENGEKSVSGSSSSEESSNEAKTAAGGETKTSALSERADETENSCKKVRPDTRDYLNLFY